MNRDSPLPSGKIPPSLLSTILKAAPQIDDRIIVGPAVGVDCAVLEFGDRYVVLKSDPITFATDEIGWYLVHVNANDIATSGAVPKWLMLTLLLPDKKTNANDIIGISQQVYKACEQLGISVIGGHSEISGALNRPIAIGTMLGEIPSQHLITAENVSPGDQLLLTKGVPLEAVSILAHEFHDEIVESFGDSMAHEAREFLHKPGISVLRDAQIAIKAGHVTAMHDPTEGGIASGLWELAQATGLSINIDLDKIQILPLAARICELFGINPYAAISSGAMLIAVKSKDSTIVCKKLREAGIDCACIGTFDDGPPQVITSSPIHDGFIALPERDEIARLFDDRFDTN